MKTQNEAQRSVTREYHHRSPVLVKSKHGMFIIDFGDGFIESYLDYQSFGMNNNPDNNIIVFNVQEYYRYYGDEVVPVLVNLDDIGYWLKDGTYVPPNFYNANGERNHE